MDSHRQEPSHSELRIYSSGDARAALFLTDAGVLHLVRRRPDDAEKALIGHGSVFIWREGAKGETGLERWTDGRQWGPSKCRDDFLIYEEKEGPQYPLLKSTFTARRNTVGDRGALWHLIAYYYPHRIGSLRAPDTDPEYAPIVSMMPAGYFVSNRKDKSRKAKEVPPRVPKFDFSQFPTLSSPYASSSGTSASLVSPVQAPRHRQYIRPQLELQVPPYEASVSALPCKSAGPAHHLHQDACVAPNPYQGTMLPGRRTIINAPSHDYRNCPGPYAPRSGGGSGDGSSSDIYSSSPSPSPGLSPASSGLSPVDRLDEPALNPNGGTLHHTATAHLHNGYHHPVARKQTGGPSSAIYRKSCTPFSDTSNGSTTSSHPVSPVTGNSVVILPAIIAPLRADTVGGAGEDILIENPEGSARMLEDEKQLQKLNPSLAQLF